MATAQKTSCEASGWQILCLCYDDGAEIVTITAFMESLLEDNYTHWDFWKYQH